jgi:hypothetical protein
MDPVKNIVSVGNLPATVTGSTANDLYFTVPDTILTFKGKISVQINDKTAQSTSDFTILSQWSLKASFPGPFFSGSNPFVLKGKAYICIAYNKTEGGIANALWEYDPVLDIWSRKKDFPGGGRFYHTVFTLGDKAYIGLGQDYTVYPNIHFIDFWEYDPDNDTWKKEADYPGLGLDNCVGFSAIGKGFVAGGFNQNVSSGEVWQYDPMENTWTRKNDITNPVFSAMDLSGTVYLANHDGCIYNYDPESDSFFLISFMEGIYTFKGMAMQGFLYYFGEVPNRTIWKYNCSSGEWSSLSRPSPFIHFEDNLDFSIGNMGYTIARDEDGKMYGFTPDNM